MCRTAIGKALILSILFVALISGCGERPGEDAQTNQWALVLADAKGPGSVVLRVRDTQITFAETLELQIETSAGQGYRIDRPDLETSEDFGVLDEQQGKKRLSDTGKVFETWLYLLEPLTTGELVIEGLTFAIVPVDDGQGKSYELEIPPIQVQVESMLGSGQAEEGMADISDVVTVEREISLRQVLVFVAAVLVCAVLAGWLLTRRRQKPVRYITADAVALRRLEILEQMGLIEAGKIEETLERLSAIVRYYIEDRFGIRAPEQTTQEFLHEVRTGRVLEPDQQKQMGDFLAQCDLVKFAKHPADRQEAKTALDMVRKFVVETASDEVQLEERPDLYEMDFNRRIA